MASGQYIVLKVLGLGIPAFNHFYYYISSTIYKHCALTSQVHLYATASPLPSSSSQWWPSSAVWMLHTSPWRKCCCCCGRPYWLVCSLFNLHPDIHLSASDLNFLNICAHQLTLGGFEELQEMKVRGRERLNLPALPEDSIKVVRAMRAASPPASAMELIEQQQQQKRGRRSRRVNSLYPKQIHVFTASTSPLCQMQLTIIILSP